MVKARVKPNNSYGGIGAGVIVEVEPEEIERAHWCLEPVHHGPLERMRAAEVKIEQLHADLDKAHAEYDAACAELDALTAPPPAAQSVAVVPMTEETSVSPPPSDMPPEPPEQEQPKKGKGKNAKENQ